MKVDPQGVAKLKGKHRLCIYVVTCWDLHVHHTVTFTLLNDSKLSDLQVLQIFFFSYNTDILFTRCSNTTTSECNLKVAYHTSLNNVVITIILFNA